MFVDDAAGASAPPRRRADIGADHRQHECRHRDTHSIRWGDDVSAEAKQQYRQALDALRGIPELLGLTCGDDAGHFDGNFELVAVMDFADFVSARVYIEHPLHQTYVRDHARKVIGDRVVVEHDWTPTVQVDAGGGRTRRLSGQRLELAGRRSNHASDAANRSISQLLLTAVLRGALAARTVTFGIRARLSIDEDPAPEY